MSRRTLRYLAYIAAFLLLACDGTTAPTAGTAARLVADRHPEEMEDDLFEDHPISVVPRPLARCRHFDYDSAAADIGPEGGRLTVGPQEFVIPAGALDRSVRISMVIPGDNTSSVRFRPEGLRFNSRTLPTLRLNFAGCKPMEDVLPTIVYVDENLNVLEWMLSWRNWTSARITTNISHFSRYAVAW